MNTLISRRHLLASSTTVMLATSLTGTYARAATPALTLERRTLEVNGKAASVFGIQGPNGKPGLSLTPGERFAFSVNNRCGEASIIHWHGQTPPPAQDGVTDTGYVGPIGAGTTRGYDFAPRPGTHWMHSHQGLQEQSLMAAPLIVHSADDTRLDAQEVVVLLHDFTFRDPAEILASLTGRRSSPSGTTGSMMGGGGMMGGSGMAGGGMMSGNGGMGMDLNDIDFDAYLANDRTLNDPDIVTASAGAQIRLRLINGATATNFWIDLGALQGQLIAVDGDAVRPITVSRFPLAGAQRADVLLRLPGAGTYPIIAQREGGRERTGIIIATPGAAIAKLTSSSGSVSAACGLGLEAQLTAAQLLSGRAPDRVHQVTLTGGMMGYNWGINGLQWSNHQPLIVKAGERVAFDMVSNSMMAHPMHLHGHHFQVVEVNGTAISGAMRDTVLVPPMATVRIVIDANNPGRWLFHCHNLYHMASGMMTELIYT
ncbi:MAG: copper oxidase [Acidocella sp. 35-58-6]|nr:MAG: copper oxidase [Acidocella sp. 35-58-6]